MLFFKSNPCRFFYIKILRVLIIINSFAFIVSLFILLHSRCSIRVHISLSFSYFTAFLFCWWIQVICPVIHHLSLFFRHSKIYCAISISLLISSSTNLFSRLFGIFTKASVIKATYDTRFFKSIYLSICYVTGRKLNHSSSAILNLFRRRILSLPHQMAYLPILGMGSTNMVYSIYIYIYIYTKRNPHLTILVLFHNI